MQASEVALKEVIIQFGVESGFDIVRVTSADAFRRDEAAALKRIRDGHMDGYSWYTEERVRRANRPQELLEGAQSVISLALSYNTGQPEPPDGHAARQDSPLRVGRRLPRCHQEAAP